MSEREFDLPGIKNDSPEGLRLTDAFDAALTSAGITTVGDARCVQGHSGRMMAEVIAMYEDHRIPVDALRELVMASVDAYAAWLERRSREARERAS